MRSEILHMLRRARQLEEQIEELAPDERLVVEILLDGEDGKVTRICDELSISKTTAYRRIDEILEEFSNFLRPF